MSRDKRRTVLYLHEEDYAFLEQIAEYDGDTRGRSATKLIRWLRRQDIESFETLRDRAVRKLAPTGATSVETSVN